MKAQDLMVGDWMIVDNEAMQVMPTLIDALFYDDPIKVEPIKISPEILEANGFKKTPTLPLGCFDYVFRSNGKTIYAEPSMRLTTLTANFNGKITMVVEYVHELQHIIRLIGINDLADNFKIF